jgi:hypothetical protein
MASLLGRPMLQFGLENEHNKCGLEGQQTVSSPGGEEQKRDPKPSVNGVDHRLCRISLNFVIEAAHRRPST